MNLPKQLDISSDDWPKHYPNVLKEVSWCIYGNAGPYTNYNVHMKSKDKRHPLLLMGVVKNIFINNGCKMNKDYYELCLHFTRCVKVVFNEDECRFEIKKKLKDDEAVFKFKDWKLRCEKIGLTSTEEMIDLFKMLSTKCIEQYNMLIVK